MATCDDALADVDVREPDEKSIMTYVAQFLRYSKDGPDSEEDAVQVSRRSAFTGRLNANARFDPETRNPTPAPSFGPQKMVARRLLTNRRAVPGPPCHFRRRERLCHELAASVALEALFPLSLRWISDLIHAR